MVFTAAPPANAGSAILPTRQSGDFSRPTSGGRPFVGSYDDRRADLGEHALLARLLPRLPRPIGLGHRWPWRRRSSTGAGRNERLVVTTDAVVEGVHFSRAFSSPADIGHKALAVNLSDLAAMAATPRWALLSLVLPGSWLVADVEDLVDGLAALAGRHGVAVVGGNITRTDGPVVVDVTAGGEVTPRRWLTRGGARAGHDIWVSGAIGGAAAGLEMLRAASPGAGIGPDPRIPVLHRADIDALSRESDSASRWVGRARHVRRWI